MDHDRPSAVELVPLDKYRLESSVAESKVQKRKLGQTWRVVRVATCCVIAALPTLISGITISIPSTVALDISDNDFDLPQDFQLTTTDKSVFAVSSI